MTAMKPTLAMAARVTAGWGWVTMMLAPWKMATLVLPSCIMR